nr:unnamed protein product [Spirometra erinaceieuropaei]
MLSLILLNYAIDWTIGRALHEDDGVEFAPRHRLTDLDHADDIALLASSFGDLQSMVSRLNEVAKSVGLSMNVGKTKVFRSCILDQEKAPLGIDGCQLEEVDSCKYLGVRQFEPVYPLYYGWFWAGQQSCRVEEQALPSGTGNKVDSFPFSETEAMIASSFRSFLALLNLPTVRKQLAQMCGLSPDVEATELATFWTSVVNPPFGASAAFGTRSQGLPKPSRPHITSMFCASGKSPGSREYAESKAVAEALLGALHTVSVSGLFVSARVVGLRIHLDESLLDLWKGEDNAVIAGAAHIVRPAGCRAHVTLALAAGISPVETGLEVLRIVDAETAGTQDTPIIPMPDGSVHDFVVLDAQDHTSRSSQDHIYYYEFSVPRTCRVLFGAHY